MHTATTSKLGCGLRQRTREQDRNAIRQQQHISGKYDGGGTTKVVKPPAYAQLPCLHPEVRQDHGTLDSMHLAASVLETHDSKTPPYAAAGSQSHR